MDSKILAEVINDMRSREKKGIETYSTTMDRKDLNEEQRLQHAYEEALDMAQYLKKDIITLNTIQDLVSKHPNDTELGMLIRNKYGKA